MCRFAAIDLKSYYASVECVARGLDPLGAYLAVADETRTDKTICLAVSPALKALGISGRPRLYEVKQRLADIKKSTGRDIPLIIAPPRMAKYQEISSRIYNIYLNYVSSEDIHIYSIDEVFIDITAYLRLYKNPDGSDMTAYELVRRMIQDVLDETGITATAGIGTNMYLCKIAMDIVAKHAQPDKDGVRIAELDEMSYRRLLWAHRPITDLWRIGKGTARRLAEHGMYTMGDVAKMSLLKSRFDPDSHTEDYPNTQGAMSGQEFLFKLFGVDAEILIDHAWGIDGTRMCDIKNYKTSAHSVSSGQVLSCAYSKKKGRVILREMVDVLSLDLVRKGLVTNRVTVDTGYDRAGAEYSGEVHTDRYGRIVPKPAHASEKVEYTSSARLLTEAAIKAYDRSVDAELGIKRLNITFGDVLDEKMERERRPAQLDIFDLIESSERKAHEQELKRERAVQKAVLEIKEKYGKNAILKGTNFEEGATMRERNCQIGGHKA